MMSARQRLTKLTAGYVAVVLALAACGGNEQYGGCRLELPQREGDDHVQWVGEVRFCRERPSRIDRASVQLLVDNSGSMEGLRRAVPGLHLWLRQGVSGLVGSYLELGQFRTCYFNASAGIGECTGGAAPLPRPTPRGNTNLHEGILSARDYDLTLIATDGVAFTGSGTGDCGGGVDAACVARSVLDVLEGYSPGASPGGGGLWLIPLVSEFRGPFYAEVPVRPHDFALRTTVSGIQEEVGRSVELASVRTDGAGNLVYDYHGPKIWFVMIISRNANLGRAAIQALWEQRITANIAVVDSIANYRAGIGAFQPIEVLPGYVPSVGWKLGAREDVVDSVRRRDRCGTIGLELSGGGLQLRCLAGEHAELLRRVQLSPVRRESGCVDIAQLPPLEFRIAGAGAHHVRDFSIGPALGALDLHMACEVPTAAAEDTPGILRVDAVGRPGLVADCLGGPSGCGQAVVSRIRALSATEPAAQPQRIFGLVQMLQRVLSDAGTRQWAVSTLLEAPFTSQGAER